MFSENLLKIIAKNDFNHFLKHSSHSILQSLSSYNDNFVSNTAYSYSCRSNRKKLLISKISLVLTKRRSTIHNELYVKHRHLLFSTGREFI
jgi:hypothetical protein